MRRGRAQEKIITIDAVVRTLDPDILVIADAEKPLAIAGIMGGENSEVGNFTTDILLEAAIFSPVLVRRARQKLGLESESSYRFERGIDFQTVQDASDQAAQLIQQLCGGRYALAKSAGLAKVKEKTINLSLAKANQILGTDIPSGKIRNILTGLSFKLRPQGEDMLKVRVPAYRQDVNLEIDLVEEIARIYGYAKIPTTLPEVSLDVITLGRRSLVPAIKNILIGLGLNEVVTYGLIDPQALKDLAGVTPPIEILNPISAQQAVLRPTLIPGLLKSVASNLNQKQPYINIFEVAKVFSGSADRPKEELSLGVALCGLRQVFLRQGVVKEEAGLLHLKGTLESLFSRLGILNYSFHQGQGPGEFDVYIGKEKVGQMRQIVQPLREEFGIKNKDVFVLEVGLESIISEAKLEKRFTALAVYPGIARDISFILRENIPVADLLRAVKERGGALLQEARVVDYYQGRQIPAGFKGLTVSCLYRSPQRTLTEAEVSPIHALVCAVLKDRFSAQIR